MDILKVVFVIIGTLIGAGFASGKEIYIFFYSFGIKGIFGIIMACLIMGIIIYKTFKIICKFNISNYKEFLDCILRNDKLKIISSMIINIFILISFYIMISGFGAYMQQELNINSILGSCILAMLCFIVFRKNVNGLVKINEILIPILIIVVILIRSL